MIKALLISTALIANLAATEFPLEKDAKQNLRIALPAPTGWPSFQAYVVGFYFESEPVQGTILCQALQQIESTYLADTNATDINFLRQQVLGDQLQKMSSSLIPLPGSPVSDYMPVYNFLYARANGAGVQKEPSCLDSILSWFY